MFVIKKKQREMQHTHRGKGNRMETETRVMQPQVKESGSHQKPEFVGMILVYSLRRECGPFSP